MNRLKHLKVKFIKSFNSKTTPPRVKILPPIEKNPEKWLILDFWLDISFRKFSKFDPPVFLPINLTLCGVTNALINTMLLETNYNCDIKIQLKSLSLYFSEDIQNDIRNAVDNCESGDFAQLLDQDFFKQTNNNKLTTE